MDLTIPESHPSAKNALGWGTRRAALSEPEERDADQQQHRRRSDDFQHCERLVGFIGRWQEREADRQSDDGEPHNRYQLRHRLSSRDANDLGSSRFAL